MRLITDGKRHLICVPYSVPNLHKMAGLLGLRRCWYHRGKNLPHYDIPHSRLEEIRALCGEIVSPREIVRIIRDAQSAAP